MKYILLILVILSCSFLKANAQLDKGVWLFGGTGSFDSYNEDYKVTSDIIMKSTDINLSASVGYFFMDKFCTGLRPYFSSSKMAVEGSYTSNSYQFAIGPFVRYYFLNPDKEFNLLTDISYQMGINKNNWSNYSTFGKGKLNTLSIMVGAEVFFNSAIGIEVLMGYKNEIVSIDYSPGTIYSTKRGFQMSIGFQFHLEQK